MYCKHCGKEIAEDSKYCRFCGTNTDIKQSKEFHYPHIKRSNRLFLICFSVYFIFITVIKLEANQHSNVTLDDLYAKGTYLDTIDFIQDMLIWGILLPLIVYIIYRLSTIIMMKRKSK